MTTLKARSTRRTVLSPLTTTEPPLVWPFPTYKGQPYRPPKISKPKELPVWETAPVALF